MQSAHWLLGEIQKTEAVEEDGFICYAVIWTSEIDYREYLLFNTKNMIARASIDKSRFSFSYSDIWWEGKGSKHYFEISIEAETAFPKVELFGIEGLEVKDRTLVYTFPCNPQKMHYSQRTYKKYFDGFKKILEYI